MATTINLHSSGATCKLLLPRLLELWLPDYNAAHHENSSSPINEPAPNLRVPPLISFLEGLPDVIATNELFPSKRLPCGHVVSIRSILACCNLFGDAIWTPPPHSYGCADIECELTLEFPKIPDPGVLDGLEARLDLIEWSWENIKPTEPERDVARLLRNILNGIGHVSQVSGPETDADDLQPKASASSLKQTLDRMETEAFALMVTNRKKSKDAAVRGTEPYCSYRASISPVEADLSSRSRYPMLSPGQECDCVTPHEFVREPCKWSVTPAETIDLDPDDEEPTDDEKEKNKQPKGKKTVRFVGPVVVTQVRYFEPWWCNEYRDSDRYWSTGPHRLSVDPSTSADDDWEVEMMENPRALVAEMLRVMAAQAAERREGECSDDDDDDDDEILKELNEDEDEDEDESEDETVVGETEESGEDILF